ncbi:GNAT family N-acetyltransferase [Lentibacter algarum]|uniref:GNAT family N-acetyltransferase n=1 Tax=Lentibacter algarum TaxID=576131 RepID=UPI001C06AF68|nr:GNAT family N-acetyltransferase [Lentibacter algarum]MBU2982386.1 GNAT family N-acetyltransferase [Lentibacter algarum]
MLECGYHDVPAGHTASVVTYLEMHARPAARPEADLALTLERISAPSVNWYRALFRSVGADYLWFGRLTQPEAELHAQINDSDVHVYALKNGSEEVGLLELDFRQQNTCELAYFGLTGSLVGGGAGRWLMNRAISLAWAEDITRLHVHTCTLDHPKALAFYIRSGFTPYKRQIEIEQDPRSIGLLPKTAAPQIPIL